MNNQWPSCPWPNVISCSDDWDVVVNEQNSRGSHLATLLLLADSRFPTGGHAHSGGVESVHALGRMTTIAEYHRFHQMDSRTVKMRDIKAPSLFPVRGSSKPN